MADTALISWTGSYPRCPCANGSCPCPTRYGTCLPSTATPAVGCSGVFVRAVSGWLRRRAKEQLGFDQVHTGGITFIQRFSGSLSLNIHFHSLFIDGVYKETDTGVRFFVLPPPAMTMSQRFARWLRAG